MINGSEKAKMPTTTPIDAQIKESRAARTLEASPWAVRNKNPETSIIIMDSPINIGHINPKILTITVQKFAVDNGIPGGFAGSNATAKRTPGTLSKTIDRNAVINFLFLKNIKAECAQHHFCGTMIYCCTKVVLGDFYQCGF